jgi:hypothetical protein
MLLEAAVIVDSNLLPHCRRRRLAVARGEGWGGGHFARRQRVSNLLVRLISFTKCSVTLKNERSYRENEAKAYTVAGTRFHAASLLGHYVELHRTLGLDDSAQGRITAGHTKMPAPYRRHSTKLTAI